MFAQLFDMFLTYFVPEKLQSLSRCYICHMRGTLEFCYETETLYNAHDQMLKLLKDISARYFCEQFLCDWSPFFI